MYTVSERLADRCREAPLDYRRETFSQANLMSSPTRAYALQALRISRCGSSLLVFSAAALVVSCDGPTEPGVGPVASMAVVGGQGQNGVVGKELVSPLQARALDAEGRPVAGQTVTFVVTSGGGSVTGGTVTSETGTVEARWTLGTSVAETQTVEARAVHPNTGQTLAIGVFTATPTPDVGIISGEGGGFQSFEAGTVAPESLSVSIKDKYGNPVPNVTVQWQPAAGSGTVSPTSSTTRADGVTRTQWTTGTASGSQSVTATATGVQGSPLVFTGTAVISPAQIAIHAGNNQTATTGTPVPTRPSVIIRDKNGNPCCAGMVVRFVVSTGGGSIVGDPEVVVDASGVATVGGWILGPTPGGNSLVAGISGVTPINFSATAKVPRVEFVVQPSSAIAYDVITPAVQVSVRDESGNPVRTEIFLSLSGGDANATLGGDVNKLVVDGIATFSDLTVSAPGSGYALVATSPAGGGSAVATSSTFNIAPRTHDVWTTKAPMTFHRTNFDAAVVNGIVYAMGGTGVNSAQGNPILAYNPATDTWTSTGSNSIRRNDVVGVVNSVIYSTNGTLLDAYTPATNTWATKAPLPIPVQRASAAVVNGLVYVEGMTAAGDQSVLQSYDPGSNTWTTRTAPSMAVAGTMTELGGILYLAGYDLGVLLAYDPNTDAWTTKAPMLVVRHGFGLASLNGLIYAVGGALGGGDPSSPQNQRRLANVESYDPASNTWTTRLPMPTKREGLAVAVVNGVMYAIGGDSSDFLGATPTNVNEAYVP